MLTLRCLVITSVESSLVVIVEPLLLSVTSTPYVRTRHVCVLEYLTSTNETQVRSKLVSPHFNRLSGRSTKAGQDKARQSVKMVTPMSSKYLDFLPDHRIDTFIVTDSITLMMVPHTWPRPEPDLIRRNGPPILYGNEMT